MSKQLVNLREYEQSDILPYILLTHDEKFYLKELSTYKDERRNDKYRFRLFEYKNGFQFKAESWVGVIELSNIRIQITPKFDRGFTRLMEMLCFLHELPYHNQRETSGELGDSDFVELLTQMFLLQLQRLLQIGIVKEYVTIEENLNQIRGRPDFLMNMRLNVSTPTRMYCRYDELLTDVPENQVLRSALEVLLRLPVFDSTKRIVRRYLGEFEEICESYMSVEWPLFQYTRLNKHYQKVHELAYYIIHRIFLKNIFKSRDQSYFSMLMDMNELFEQFAAKLLQTYLPKTTYSVITGEEYRHVIRKGPRWYSYIKPDIVVHNQQTGTPLVLDVKYKNYGKDHIKNQDIYQLAFYAHSFHTHSSQTSSVHLIYPKYVDAFAEEQVITLLPNTSHEIELRAKPLSIEDCLDLIKTKQLPQLTETALALISPSI